MMVKRIVGKIYEFVAPLFFFAFRIFKIKGNKVVITNCFGKGYGDNQKYICDELIKREINTDIVWLVRNIDDDSIPNQIRKVKYNSFKAIYEIVTAKLWIDNFRKPLYYRKRKGQYYIQLWHGCGALKKIEFDVEDKLSKDYKKSMINDNNMIDLMVSNSIFFSEKCRSAFRYNGKVLEVGVPREDALINNHQEMSREIKDILKIGKSRVLLYAPTFRNNFNKSTYDIDFTKLMNNWKEKKEDWIVLVRLHPHVSNMSDIFNYDERLINVSNYPDMQELIAVADIIITDYSSIMFEAMEIDKKVILYANDINSYVDERGFYFDLKELPFPVTRNNNELLKSINDNRNFIDSYEKFKKKMGYYEGHNSTSVIVDYINDLITPGDKYE